VATTHAGGCGVATITARAAAAEDDARPRPVDDGPAEVAEPHAGAVDLNAPSVRHVTERQAGTLSRTQAVAVGLTRSQVVHAVSSGRWRRLHPGVYATFTGPLPFATRLWAALLHAGPSAVACHGTAGFLQGLVDDEPAVVEVSVPDAHRVARRPGVRVHRTRRHATRRHPARSVPQTLLEDTVLDLTEGCAREDDVVGWLTRACQRRLTSPERLKSAVARRARLRHRRLVQEVLDQAATGVASALERRYVRDVQRAHGLPRSDRNAPAMIGGVRRYPDVRYRPQRATVQLEGLAYHPPNASARDDARDNAAVIAGDAVLRYGWVAVVRSPCTVAAEVAAVLRRRGWAGQLRPCSVDCGAVCVQHPA